jgi:hypothetical protein
MRLRDEMAERAVAAAHFGPATQTNPPLSGWTVYSDDWSDHMQAAVSSVMTYTNAVFEMVLRLAEAIDELRDTLDVQGNKD